MNIELIRDSYKNDFNIDLETIHNKMFYKSKSNNSLSLSAVELLEDFGVLKTEKNEEDDYLHELPIELTSRTIVFNDYISSKFELIVFEGKIFLLGDKTCYPCGNIVKSAFNNLHWVPILLLPKQHIIITENHIEKSSVIFTYSFQNLRTIINDNNIIDFLLIARDCFSQNTWYNLGLERNELSDRDLPFDVVHSYLHDHGLFSMFEYAFNTVYFGFKITHKDILNVLNFDSKKKGIFSYLNFLSKEFKLPKRLQEMISKDDFVSFIESLSSDEIYDLFEVDFIESYLLFDNISDDHLDDIFQIRIFERYNVNYHVDINKLINNLKEINITKALLDEYYSRIKSNLIVLENSLRKRKGLPEVGAYYKEVIVLNFFKLKFPNYSVFAQHSPKWLERQRFDVYIDDLNIAIEYNGKQHYEEIDFFGGKEGLDMNIKRDKAKERKCLENNCKLYIIKYDEDLHERLEDIYNEIIQLVP